MDQNDCSSAVSREFFARNVRRLISSCVFRSRAAMALLERDTGGEQETPCWYETKSEESRCLILRLSFARRNVLVVFELKRAFSLLCARLRSSIGISSLREKNSTACFKIWKSQMPRPNLLHCYLLLLLNQLRLYQKRRLTLS